MYGSMWTSSVGLKAGSDRMDATGHNIANISSDGFRRHDLSFRELTHAQEIEHNPATALQPVATGSVEVDPSVLARGHGVRSRPVQLDDADGPLRQTAVPEDLAVQGEGYFVLGDRAGEDPVYTRLGAFRLDDESHLVHPGGLYLLDADGEPIQVPEEAEERISVSSGGEISVVVSDGEDDAAETVATIELAVPPEGAKLDPLGDGTYDMVGEDGAPLDPDMATPGADGAGSIRSGYLEGSNVDLSTEMMEMILAQRAFQLNARTLQTADQMLEGATDLRR